MEPIEFRDEEGLRWTVERRTASGDAPREAVLDLLCETGERRVYRVRPVEEEHAWDGVNERAWRAILRRAHVVRAPAEGAWRMRRLTGALAKQLAHDLGVEDWHEVQDALARRAPLLIRLDAQPEEFSAEEYWSLCDAVATELARGAR